eukprot:3029998-Pleurochrysis_carterae.AAC.1
MRRIRQPCTTSWNTRHGKGVVVYAAACSYQAVITSTAARQQTQSRLQTLLQVLANFSPGTQGHLPGAEVSAWASSSSECPRAS